MSTVRLSTTRFLTAIPCISSPATAFRIAVQWWYEQVPHQFDPYRPELHYMRGPGPKSYEKVGVSERALIPDLSR